jgi:hypothetical protein
LEHTGFIALVENAPRMEATAPMDLCAAGGVTLRHARRATPPTPDLAVVDNPRSLADDDRPAPAIGALAQGTGRDAIAAGGVATRA